ncbi:MAG: dCTP deaminase [Synergistaceae bacterium]|nr:dCTP deaminase [Synergistaceae bacterium]MDI3532693.1 dCTP deaminase [Synergistaceae bacterium]HPU77753.1 dCTP deaminase [Thermosynergistes sp.]
MKGVCSAREIVEMLESGDLVVTPLLDIKRQLGRASLDVRLGLEFVLFRRGYIPSLDAGRSRHPIADYYDRARLEYGDVFVLHPGQFALSSTLEFFKLPSDVMAYVIGRSSWGRLGLVIATATFVDPNFRGSITLELVNEGEVPLVLYPGTRVAQLVFHRLNEPAPPYEGKYALDTRATASKAHRDEELSWLSDKEGY